jgi:hypothetical protein
MMKKHGDGIVVQVVFVMLVSIIAFIPHRNAGRKGKGRWTT